MCFLRTFYPCSCAFHCLASHLHYYYFLCSLFLEVQHALQKRRALDISQTSSGIVIVHLNVCLCIQSYPCSQTLVLFLLNQPCNVLITLQPQKKKHFDLTPIQFFALPQSQSISNLLPIILLSGINRVKSSSLYIHHRMTLQYSSTPTCCIFSHPAILKILLHPWFILFFKALLSLYFFQPSALRFYLKKKMLFRNSRSCFF